MQLTDDMQCVQKSVRSADFFDIVILSLFSYIEKQVIYSCGIKF